MFSILKKLFNDFGQKKPNTHCNGLSHQMPPQTISKTLSPLDSFRQEVQNIGNPNYPFLSKDYSPNSRVPSADLTPFIIERLRNNDIASIIDLMHEILSANPGLGCGPDWIDKEIKEIIQINFDDYLKFSNPDHYNYLKAMWIVASKGGGGREFWLTNDTPELFSLALCCHIPWVQPTIVNLAEKANRFISRMAKDIPYWKDYPKFSKNTLIVQPPNKSDCVQKVEQLTISARLHFFFASERGGGSLPLLTNYAIRDFGISTTDTPAQLMRSGLFIPSHEPSTLSNSTNKQDLIDMCTKAKVDVRKSWKKDKLSQALYDNSPDYFMSIATNMNLVRVNPEYEIDIATFHRYAKELTQAFKVLCFI